MSGAHGMSGSAASRNKRALTIVFFTTLAYLVAEVIGGWWTGSLALLAILNAVRIQRMDYSTPGTGATPPAAPATLPATNNLSVVEKMPRELREGPQHHNGNQS